MDYIRGLIDSGRENEVPRWLIVSDFRRMAIHDLEPEQDPELPLLKRLPPSIEFDLRDLHKNVRQFAFIAGYKYHKLNPEDPANFEATELMARLHDSLYDGGYRGHELCQFLVRLLFCFFAEDTGIFPSDAFKLYLMERTAEDGSDLGAKLAHLFQVLNTPSEHRGKNLDEDLAQFDYINGDLFSEPLSFADFTTSMRTALIACADFKWEKISPAIFGSLFQTIFDHADDRKRRQLGAHYTTEKNIMKVVRSLFLDELRSEFESAKSDKSGRGPGRLRDLQNRLASLRFLDPACGCGNFLVITYRELRQLELEILIHLEHDYLSDQAELIDKQKLDVSKLSKINVDQMYGIEIEEFPARIAEVALWLTDHQANTLLSEAFGERFARIPLRKSPQIRVQNALRCDWKEIIAPRDCSYILGNPPFVGKTYQHADQKVDMDIVWGDVKGAGLLDFVTCWHRLAAEYIQGTKIKVAFVSTNSICQGEQVGILWGCLLSRYRVKILFAHRTFAWESEARGKAHVHCVIIGFGLENSDQKKLFDYDDDPQNPVVSTVGNISPYLVAGSDIVVSPRTQPICHVPEMVYGSKPTDGGHLILTTTEKEHFLRENPTLSHLLRPFLGAEEFINGMERWCLWLKDASPSEIRSSSELMRRIEAVRTMRLASKKEPTRRDAATPSLFAEIRQSDSNYLAVPEVSSERRNFIPIAFLSKNIICSNKIQFVSGATLYHLGILSSTIHMAWMKQVCGRLKSDFSYSSKIVYNNFPWPESVTDAQRESVEQAAQAVLDARALFPTSTLADLYDPVSMPPVLAKAHTALDKAVEKCYRKEPFASDRTRVEYLFALYEKITAPLIAAPKKNRLPRKSP
jgi:type I restriction-modification system DNA methylase subunit